MYGQEQRFQDNHKFIDTIPRLQYTVPDHLARGALQTVQVCPQAKGHTNPEVGLPRTTRATPHHVPSTEEYGVLCTVRRNLHTYGTRGYLKAFALGSVASRVDRKIGAWPPKYPRSVTALRAADWWVATCNTPQPHPTQSMA